MPEQFLDQPWPYPSHKLYYDSEIVRVNNLRHSETGLLLKIIYANENNLCRTCYIVNPRALIERAVIMQMGFM